jgi:hypothetical protein
LAVQTLFAQQLWLPGQNQVDVVIPLAVTRARLSLDRSALNGAEGKDDILLDAWLSMDNGSTWLYAAGCGIPGGLSKKADNSTRTESGMAIVVPSPELSTRQIRVNMTTQNPLHIALTLDLT